MTIEVSQAYGCLVFPFNGHEVWVRDVNELKGLSKEFGLKFKIV